VVLSEKYYAKLVTTKAGEDKEEEADDELASLPKWCVKSKRE
jgi:hypothetical protein